MLPVTEHVVKTPRHTTFYLACGPEGGTPIIFVHGWPELSISWRHQLPCFASLGFRAIAPDMRGYGRSSAPGRHEDYALEHTVADMLELADALGIEKALWVGHDWGSPVVWALASHHPERCHALASLCVPYLPGGLSPDARAPLIDRSVYPEDRYPAGQWDYQLFYVESFAKAQAEFEADVEATVKVLFRKGSPAGKGKPSRTADVRRQGGWFGPLGKAPPMPRDADVISEQDLATYTAALMRNGFFGPNSWYMNHERNNAFARHAKNGGRIALPVLFLHGAYDYVCETMQSRLAEPMRAHCSDLAEVVVESGHWMAQEKPVDVNAALAAWLARKLPGLWRSQPKG
ncbi:MAG: alpha/beta hydrolase [Hyphomicrobiaceae bacterium]|nr:alpha/beta hydrolase [Hyphomicrobiaceae bacterium]